MLYLSNEQAKKKIEFIDSYTGSANAADGSKYDPNSNVTSKNIATLAAELHKDTNIAINRTLMFNEITNCYGEDLAKEYIRQLEHHEIYKHDETGAACMPYCVSVSMYPLLTGGMKQLGAESTAPQHLSSFCGSFCNLVFAISAQFVGAVATVEFLTYFDYFARKDYGDNYLNDNKKLIDGFLQQVVYTINQPAAARGYQSCFWNISLYDEYYFNSLFENFVFPDMTAPIWESVKSLQVYFMEWFRKEREKALLTFPVVTAAMLTANNEPRDKEFAMFCASELAQSNSFFMYLSDSADSLSSCCRLRSEVSDNTFSYTLGAGGVATGSISVMTINMNRLVQNALRAGEGDSLSRIDKAIEDQVIKIHKYQACYRKIVERMLANRMLPVYDAGFITLDKQYLTIGINGMVEAAEFCGLTPNNNAEYIDFVSGRLKIIFDLNKNAKSSTGIMYNTEFVPAESLGVKNSKWDKQDGYVVNRDCYNSYFYAVEDDSVNALDKLVLHGADMVKYLDGGSALHLNLDDYLDQEAFYKLICCAAKSGTNYFCTNVKVTCCEDCGHIDKRTKHSCSACGSDNISWATRVIGYLKKVSSYSSERKKEHSLRFYHKNTRKVIG